MLETRPDLTDRTCVTNVTNHSWGQLDWSWLVLVGLLGLLGSFVRHGGAVNLKHAWWPCGGGEVECTSLSRLLGDERVPRYCY